MAGQHVLRRHAAWFIPRGRHAATRRSSAVFDVHRATPARTGIAAFTRVVRFIPLTLLAAAGIVSATAEPATAVIVGGSTGGTATSITTLEFMDATTARIVGCGNGDRGMAEQQALVLIGVTSDGTAVPPQLGPESVFRTSSGDWNCGTGTVVAPEGVELSGIAGKQPAGSRTSLWRVDNPHAGPAFGEPAIVHSGPGTPPRLATPARAQQSQRDVVSPPPITFTRRK